MSADKPTNLELKELQERIEKYVRDAERHLNLPPDAIGNIWYESDYGFVLKMCGVIEPLLKEAVREHVRRAMEHPKVATSGSEALLKAIGDLGVDRLRTIVTEFGAINAKISDFIYALFQVRNRYAHHIANAHLTVNEICEKIAAEPGGERQLLSKLSEPLVDAATNPSVLRLVMFYSVARFLADALHLAKPPPVPTGGILGPYFDLVAKGGDEGWDKDRTSKIEVFGRDSK